MSIHAYTMSNLRVSTVMYLWLVKKKPFTFLFGWTGRWTIYWFGWTGRRTICWFGCTIGHRVVWLNSYWPFPFSTNDFINKSKNWIFRINVPFFCHFKPGAGLFWFCTKKWSPFKKSWRCWSVFGNVSVGIHNNWITLSKILISFRIKDYFFLCLILTFQTHQRRRCLCKNIFCS